jgi:DamX protein
MADREGAEQKGPAERGAGDFSDVLRGDSPERDAQPSADVRDLEKALVERIADVDDDRRRTAMHLQKGLQMHRDEIDTQLKRQSGLLLGLLLLLGIGVAAALAWIAWQADAGREALTEQMAALQAQVTALADAPPAAEASPATGASDPLAGDVEGLGARVNSLADQMADQVQRLSAFRGETQERLAALADAAAAKPPEPPALPEQVIEEADLVERLSPLLATLERLGVEVSEIQATQRQLMKLSRSSADGGSALTERLAERLAMLEDRLPALSARVAAAESSAAESAGLMSALRRRDAEAAAGDAGAAEDEPGQPRVEASAAREAESGAEQANGGAGNAGAGGLAGSGSASEPGVAAAAASPDAAQSAPGALVRAGDRRIALQLIAFGSREALEDFVANNPLPERVYLREETYQGGPWVVLIHSLHASVEEAELARAELPSSLAALDIWIRPLPSEAQLEVVARDTGR